MYKKISEELIDFIKNSPTAFHAIDNISKRLKENGYEELLEGRRWNIKAGGKYFVTRNNSSIIALNIGTKLDNYSFNVAASHSDSPTFKIKENAEIEVRGKYTKLNTEGYGGMLCSTWFDRPLSIAGRVLVKEDDTYVTKLVDIDRDLVMIPNVAIHMNRKINDGYAYNKQVDMLPLFGGSESKPGDFNKLIANQLGVEEENITAAWVPGAFEIPITAQKMAQSGKYDAVICVGAVIRGDTSHYDLVCNESAKGIAQIELATGIPVLFGIITTENIEQAIARAGSKAGNKGYDCALSAIEMVNLIKQL